MVKVSIIVPVYNCESSIKNTINSILKQNFNDFELILINDGSEDKSGLICDELAMKDKRIKVIHQKNSGPGAARNRGINEAEGKYITFVDADDTVDVDWLDLMISTIEDNNVDLICTGYKKLFIRDDNRLIKSKDYIPTFKMYKDKKNIINDINEIISSGFFIPLWNKLYKSKIIKAFGITFREDLSLGEDFLFNLQYFDKCNSFIILDTAKYNYIVNKDGLTHKYRSNKFEILNKINDEFRQFIIKYGITQDIANYGTVKNCYSCFMDLFHENNYMKLSDKLNYIYDILNKKKVKMVLETYKPKSIKNKILVLILKSNFIWLIFIISWIFYVIKFKINKN
ncbi:MAG: glycosyltransferase family 2 protein [Clostridiales bacterium]|nr:glycosyltransferase family 2 protein [Clostridiales bacterium]